MNDTWAWKQLRHHISTKHDGFLFVLGASGVGKTYAVNTIIAEIDMDVFRIDTNNTVSSRDLKTILDRQLSTNLLQAVSGGHPRRRAILIDELESLYQLDRTIITTLSSYSLPKFLIICVCNITLDKKIRSVFSGGNTTMLLFAAPSETDICIFLKSTFPSRSHKEILEVAEQCYGNLSTALHMITTSQKEKDKDDVPVSFDTIFTTQKHDHIYHIVNEDPWLSPLRFHENLPKELMRRKGTALQKEAFYKRILNNLCNWDIMMQRVEDSCIPIDYIIHTIMQIHALEKKTLKANSSDASMSDFTKLFSNLSLQRKNEKAIYAVGDTFPWKHAQIFYDYIKHK